MTSINAGETAEPKPNLNPLKIYELIKNAQQKHGLRHENYQRYRGYCGRRIERIRKSLKFTNQYKCLPKRPGKFIARTVTPELVGDIRYLEIVVYEVERNWAYGMQFKLEILDVPLSRKKYGMRQKLRKAVKWAKFLESLVVENELVQTLTKLEVKAYSAFIYGSLALELKEWKSAIEHFDTARSSYEELLEQIRGTEVTEMYLARCHELELLLKLCRSESGDADVLLSTVGSLNLNASETEQSQKSAAMEIEVIQPPMPAKQSKNKKEMKMRKQPKPVKPFFFDLALNFIESSAKGTTI